MGVLVGLGAAVAVGVAVGGGGAVTLGSTADRADSGAEDSPGVVEPTSVDGPGLLPPVPGPVAFWPGGAVLSETASTVRGAVSAAGSIGVLMVAASGATMGDSASGFIGSGAAARAGSTGSVGIAVAAGVSVVAKVNGGKGVRVKVGSRVRKTT